MSTPDALGHLFNIALFAKDSTYDMSRSDRVTFICDQGSSVTFTLQEGINGANMRDLATIEEFHTASAFGGVWTKVTQTASATVTVDNLVAFVTVHSEDLSDGYNTVSMQGTPNVTAVFHDLVHARYPGDLEELKN